MAEKVDATFDGTAKVLRLQAFSEKARDKSND
jgi:hypothetical protein